MLILGWTESTTATRIERLQLNRLLAISFVHETNIFSFTSDADYVTSISVSSIFCSRRSSYLSRGTAQFQICQFLCAAFNCFKLVILIVCPSYGIVYLHLFALFSQFQCLSSINTISVPWLNFTTITFSRQQTFIPKYLDNTLIDFA